MSHLRPRPGRGRAAATPEPPDDRPHIAARFEDVVNRQRRRLMQLLRYEVRIQPFYGYGAPGELRVLAKLLYASRFTPANHHDLPVRDLRTMAVRGWRNFTSTIAAHHDVEVRIGETVHTVRSDRSGLIDVVLPNDLPPGHHEISISTSARNAVTATVRVFKPDQDLVVVSDVDDTIMVTMLPRPLLAFWNAFIIHQSSRQPVSGMPELYQRITQADPDTPFIYLSTGAWNVFPVLQRFLHVHNYPRGPMLLTDWGPTNTGFFRSGQLHKKTALERLAERLPGMRFLLIGDDGQHDPEIYGDFARSHPEHVRAIAIRQLTAGQQVLAHGSLTPLVSRTGAPASIAVEEAPDGFRLARKLRRAGVL